MRVAEGPVGELVNATWASHCANVRALSHAMGLIISAT